MDHKTGRVSARFHSCVSGRRFGTGGDARASSPYEAFASARTIAGGSEDHPRFIGRPLTYEIGLNEDKFNYFTPLVFLNI